MTRGLVAVACLSALASCGGSSHAPLAASVAVAGVVFYDENGNGRLDAGEDVRIPGVVVRAGAATATSGPGGTFALQSPSANASLDAAPEGLPPFFHVVPVPLGASRPSSLSLPLQLTIGANRPNVYMGFGDSLTEGQGSETFRGYLGPLADLLTQTWGRAMVVNEGIGGTTSDQGAARLTDALQRVHPAYTLIDYGTNDYSHLCRKAGACQTIANLRNMVRETRRAGSLPVIATLLPGNAAVDDALNQGRDKWVEEMNTEIRQMAREEGAAIADPFAAFTAATDPARLYADYLHPNDRGYELLAEAFRAAITRPRDPATR